MTAQHAERQGKLAANNIAAFHGLGGSRTRRRPYRHHDLGFFVDLGGAKAAANPLGVRLSGLPAKAVTRGYHLLSMPATRTRIATDWALGAIFSRQLVQLGLIRSGAVPLTAGTAEHPSLPPAAPSAATSEPGRPSAAKYNPMNTSHCVALAELTWLPDLATEPDAPGTDTAPRSSR